MTSISYSFSSIVKVRNIDWFVEDRQSFKTGVTSFLSQSQGFIDFTVSTTSAYVTQSLLWKTADHLYGADRWSWINVHILTGS